MAGPEDDGRLTGRLTLVAVLGLVLLAPPLIAAFDHGGQVLGVPVIWAYLLVVWAALIGLIAVVAGRSGGR
jgi:peptidoglycan/LPS O-acetylase OafA/YrhL